MERYDLNAVPNASSEKAGVLRVANSVDEKNCGCVDAAITPSNLYNLLGCRKANTSYTLGEIVTCPYYPEFLLKCTVAGSTAAGSLDTTSATLGKVYTDGGVKWEVINFHVVSLPKGVVSLSEYGVQENTDISIILNNLIANEAINKILLPQGTFNVNNTVNVNRAVIIEGAGAKNTTLNVTCQTGFFVTSSYQPVFTLSDVGFNGTGTNTLIEANKNGWGASFVVKNFECKGFQYFCIAKSAYNVLVENGRVLSNCKFKFTTYNDESDLTNFNNVIRFERVIYLGSPSKSTTIFETKNVIGMVVNACTFENAEVLFKNEATTNNVFVDECWIEDVDCLVENVSSKGEFNFRNPQTVRAISMIKNQTNSYLGSNIYDKYTFSGLSADNSTIYNKLLNNTPETFLERRIIGESFDVPLVKFDTTKGEIAVPVNIYTETQKGVSEISKDLWALFNYAGIRMVYTIYFYGLYSDTSAVIYKAEVFSRNKDDFRIIHLEKAYKSSWSTAKAEENCTLTLNKRTITFASPNANSFNKLEMVIEYKPLSGSIT